MSTTPLSGGLRIRVRSDFKGKGLWLLLNKLIAYGRMRGAEESVDKSLGYDRDLIRLMRQLEFEATNEVGADTMRLRLVLRGAKA